MAANGVALVVEAFELVEDVSPNWDDKRCLESLDNALVETFNLVRILLTIPY